MERFCELTVTIGNYNALRIKSIISACMVEWCFKKYDFGFVKPAYGRRRLLQASSMGTLYEFEDASWIINRIEQAVWRANGGYVEINITPVMRSDGLCRVSDPLYRDDWDL